MGGASNLALAISTRELKKTFIGMHLVSSLAKGQMDQSSSAIQPGVIGWNFKPV